MKKIYEEPKMLIVNVCVKAYLLSGSGTDVTIGIDSEDDAVDASDAASRGSFYDWED